MLLPRHVDMIIYLLNYDGWCSGETLCTQFHMTKKTLQGEMKLIQEELADGLNLEIGRKGYRLNALTGPARAEVHDHLVSYGENKSIDVRPASILLYLLFLRQHISMRELADMFYLSKSAIALELETVKRWLDIFEGLELEVSGTKGIRVVGEEKRKRVYCGKIASLKTFRSAPLGNRLARQYADTMEAVNAILERCLLEHDYLISGADFRRIVRFMSCAILRSNTGFGREGEAGNDPLPKVVTDIADQVLERLQYRMTDAEQQDLWAMLDQSNLISEPTTVGPELEHAMRDRLFALDDRAAELMALPEDFHFEGRQYVLQYLEKMYQRYGNGNIPVNNLDADIVKEYPLEVHIASRMFPETFGGQATEEHSSLALILGANLRVYKNKVSVLLVSNENRAVIYQIFRVLQKFGNPALREIKVIPEYAFFGSPKSYQDYDVKLTTEPETCLSDPEFFYIPDILAQEDIDRIGSHFRKKRDEKRHRILRCMEQEYPVNRIAHNEKLASLEDLVGRAEGTFQSCHVVRERVLFVCRMGPKERTQVELYELNMPLLYQHRKITRVLFVRCRERDKGLINQFDYISSLLKKL